MATMTKEGSMKIVTLAARHQLRLMLLKVEVSLVKVRAQKNRNSIRSIFQKTMFL